MTTCWADPGVRDKKVVRGALGDINASVNTRLSRSSHDDDSRAMQVTYRTTETVCDDVEDGTATTRLTSGCDIAIARRHCDFCATGRVQKMRVGGHLWPRNAPQDGGREQVRVLDAFVAAAVVAGVCSRLGC